LCQVREPQPPTVRTVPRKGYRFVGALFRPPVARGRVAQRRTLAIAAAPLTPRVTGVVLAEGITPGEDIRRLLELWRDVMPDAPHDLKWNINLRLAPATEKTPPELRSRPVAGSSLLWTGSPEAAQPHLRRARESCHPPSRVAAKGWRIGVPPS
jgi:hypothetical protein